MANFILIIICLAAGFVLKRIGRLPESTSQALNVFIIYLSFPALVLLQVPSLLASTRFGSDLLIPLSMAWLQFMMAFALFRFLGARLGWSRATMGAVILTAGLGNTSFVGFPMLEAFLGSDSLRTGIIVDQAGSFLVLSTLGLVCASAFSGEALRVSSIIKRIVNFPPFQALVFAIVLFAAGLELPSWAKEVAEKLSATLVPIALVSVGCQLHVEPERLRSRAVPLSLGLVFKLVCVPLALALLYVVAFSSRTEATLITLLEAAMAPMITAAIVAAEFDLDREIANLLVGVGIPLSLITVPLWYWCLRWVMGL